MKNADCTVDIEDGRLSRVMINSTHSSGGRKIKRSINVAINFHSRTSVSGNIHDPFWSLGTWMNAVIRLLENPSLEKVWKH